MIERTTAAGVPFGWVAGDTIYGVGELEMALRRAGKGYVPSRRGCCHPRPSQTRTCRFPASGSSGESLAPGDVAMDDPGFVDHPSNDAVRDSPVEEAPQMAMVSATPGLALARLAIRCRFVDRFAGLRVPSRVSRQRFSAPGASLPSDGSR